jgi:hypothetical protein
MSKMVHGLKQIIELNHHAYLVEMAIKEGIIKPMPVTVKLTQEQLNRLRKLGYSVDTPDLAFRLNNKDNTY